MAPNTASLSLKFAGRCFGLIPVGMPTHSILVIGGTIFAVVSLIVKFVWDEADMMTISRSNTCCEARALSASGCRAFTLLTRDYGSINGIRMLLSSMKHSEQVFVLFMFV